MSSNSKYFIGWVFWVHEAETAEQASEAYGADEEGENQDGFSDYLFGGAEATFGLR
jgi:hypothetical protein